MIFRRPSGGQKLSRQGAKEQKTAKKKSFLALGALQPWRLGVKFFCFSGPELAPA
jgi:hypothetical protein